METELSFHISWIKCFLIFIRQVRAGGSREACASCRMLKMKIKAANFWFPLLGGVHYDTDEL